MEWQSCLLESWTFVRHFWLPLLKKGWLLAVAGLTDHPPIWVLTLLGPNLHHSHRDYMKICTYSQQLDIFSHQQDIVKNAIVYSLGKAHQSRRKFAPKCTNKAKNLHWEKYHTKENHHNTDSNEKGLELHIFKATLTPAGENKGGYWLWQDLRATLPCGRLHS